MSSYIWYCYSGRSVHDSTKYQKCYTRTISMVIILEVKLSMKQPPGNCIRHFLACVAAQTRLVHPRFFCCIPALSFVFKIHTALTVFICPKSTDHQVSGDESSLHGVLLPALEQLPSSKCWYGRPSTAKELRRIVRD